MKKEMCIKLMPAAGFCLLLILMAWGPVQAADGRTGILQGRVLDAQHGVFLEGVEVIASATNQKTVTDDDGFFRLRLPEGNVSLTFKFEGYDAVMKTVRISADETDTIQVEIGEEATQLDEVVVTGSLVGEMWALNIQKGFDGYSNVISQDAIGELPDQNVAESLDRLPGISVARDQGEGRFVVIRGIDPDLNSVNLEGVPLSSPDADDRAVLLDVIPSDIVESIRVSKTVLPDQPHDSIGGHIDIRMPSAFDREERTLTGTIQGNYDDLSEELKGRGTFTFGDRFGADNMLGFLGSVTYDEREFGSDNQEGGPWEEEDGMWVPDEFEYREYDLTRKRLGLVANLEARPNINTSYFLRANYNELEDTETRHLINYGIDELVDYRNYAGTADMEVGNELKDRTETMSEYVISLGGKNAINDWTLDYTGGYSHSEEDTPDDLEAVYELEGFTGDYTDGDGYHPKVIFNSGTDHRVAADYEFDGIEDANQLVENDSWYGSVNFRKDLALSLPSFIKAGGSMGLNEKTSDIETFVSDDNPSQFDTLAGNTASGRKEFFPEDTPFISKDVLDYYSGNKDEFAMERDLVDSVVDDFETTEDVYAGYLMGGVEYNVMKFIAGVRVEYTDFESQGYQVNIQEINDEEVITATRITADNDYTNVLPGLHCRWNIADELIFRASWTNTIVRPTHEQSRNAEEIEDGDVERGNPDLDPYEAMNYDMSLRYYMSDLGMISLAAFYKDIDKFIFQQTIEEGSPYTDNDNEYGDLTTFNNGDSGEIYGIEIGYQKQFSSLPSPFDGIGFNGNITFTDSEATVPASGGEAARDIPFIKQSDTVAAASIFYEKYGITLRVAGSYRDDYLDELGEIESEDRYIDEHFQVDISTGYKVNENFKLFADFININNEPLRAYYDTSKTLSQYEEYGMQVKAGLRMKF